MCFNVFVMKGFYEMSEVESKDEVKPQGSLSLSQRQRFLRRGLPLLMCLVLLMVLALFAAGMFEGKAIASSNQGESGLIEYKVQEGDTLWDIAGQVAPERNRAEVAVQINKLNNLEGSSIDIGQNLYLPEMAQ